MKAILSSLLCFIFLQAQVFAIHGGPSQGGVVATSVVGTYAGLLIPDGSTSNSLGLFTLSVPTSGLATGTMQVFSSGRTFTGTINAVANANTGEIRGVLDASFNFALSLTVSGTGGDSLQTIDVTASATGQVDAFVVTGLSVATSAELTGTANMDISQGQVAADGSPIITESLSLTVAGIKQSDTAAAAATSTGG